jgi:hypothetical protein
MAEIGKKPLTPPDSMFLRAAEGWLGLGDWKSAEDEIQRIAPQFQADPAVLKVRWEVCALGKKWDAGVEIGRMLLEAEPDESFGWVNRSYALRRATGGGLQAAYDALRPAADHLQDAEQVTFNLACYSCQLGRLDEAREWWSKCLAGAVAVGRGTSLKQAALAESDLEPLWREISSA